MNLCAVPGCTKLKGTSSRYCNTHRHRKQKTGSFDKKPRKTVEERFWGYVQKTDGCWIWGGCLHKSGYGSLGYNRKLIKAHRFSWILHYGEIPEGLLVCHKCDNPSCVNPNHLFIGSQKDNMQDMIKKGRIADVRGSLNGNSKLTELDVINIKNLLKNNKLSLIEISKIYKVSYSSIESIYNHKTWTHINEI